MVNSPMAFMALSSSGGPDRPWLLERGFTADRAFSRRVLEPEDVYATGARLTASSAKACRTISWGLRATVHRSTKSAGAASAKPGLAENVDHKLARICQAHQPTRSKFWVIQSSLDLRLSPESQETASAQVEQSGYRYICSEYQIILLVRTIYRKTFAELRDKSDIWNDFSRGQLQIGHVDRRKEREYLSLGRRAVTRTRRATPRFPIRPAA